jgi:hypothetical protein
MGITIGFPPGLDMFDLLDFGEKFSNGWQIEIPFKQGREYPE